MNQTAAESDYIDEAANPAAGADRQYVAGIVKGDEQALVELYERYHKGVFNYIYRLIQDNAAAQDVLQEVFIAVWQGVKRFRGNSSVKTWIFRIAHNQSVTWIRNSKRIEEFGEVEIQGFIDPEEALVVNWRSEELQEALNRLSPVHRAAIELAFVHDLSYAEIAEILDCPVGTVKSRMSYAIRHLNLILKNVTELGQR